MAAAPPEVYQALRRVPRFARVSRESVGVERLGGLTNRNFRISHGGERFVLRIFGEGTSRFIDRRAEAENTRAAAQAGVGAEVFYQDHEAGFLMSRCVEDARPLTRGDFKDKDRLSRAALTLRKLHTSGRKFRGRFLIAEKLAEYRRILAASRAELPGEFSKLTRDGEELLAALGRRTGPLAPIHADTVPDNFLAIPGGLLLIDWEYSGMGDPLWDLADLSAEAGFDAGQDGHLLAAYFDAGLNAGIRGRFCVLKALSHWLWAHWGLFQSAHQGGDRSLRDHAQGRLASFAALAADPDFKRRLGEAARAA